MCALDGQLSPRVGVKIANDIAADEETTCILNDDLRRNFKNGPIIIGLRYAAKPIHFRRISHRIALVQASRYRARLSWTTECRSQHRTRLYPTGIRRVVQDLLVLACSFTLSTLCCPLSPHSPPPSYCFPQQHYPVIHSTLHSHSHFLPRPAFSPFPSA